LGLAAVGVFAAGAALALSAAFPRVPFEPPPPPPEIAVPPGQLREGAAGLQLWVGNPGRLAGSAFLLELPGGAVVGVSAAHNLILGEDRALHASLELRIAMGGSETRAEPTTRIEPDGGRAPIAVLGLYGEPGRPRRFGLDLSTDHQLLTVADPGDLPELLPDPRGGAQPGERILLLGGVDGLRHAGTVFRADERGIWCLMDEPFDPARMSGSPAASQYTGKVVGMAVAAGWHEGQLVLGLHPIGSLVAAGAADLPP
jgi:hypothetical protein